MNAFGTSDPLTIVVGSLTFWVAAIGSIVAAYLMVFQVKNLVRAALALTSVLGSVAALYGILGADFLAVVQLVVYVGAVMVLIIFAIFMTPGQVDVPGRVGRAQNVGAALVAAVVGIAAVWVSVAQPWNIRAAPLDVSTVDAIGGLMMTRYVLPFEIVSVLLTVALIGAIVVAREE